MNDRSIRGLEKLQHIPGNLEGYIHAQSCVHSQSYVLAQKGPERLLSLADLEARDK